MPLHRALYPPNAPLAKLIEQIERLPLEPGTALSRLDLDKQALKLVRRDESPLVWAQIH